MGELMLQPGDRLDGYYTIKRYLGSGAFSEVYLADCEELREFGDVALKVFKQGMEIDYEALLREASTVIPFQDNPFIVKVYHTPRFIGPYPTIAMEYMPGGALKIKKSEKEIWIVDKDGRKKDLDQEMATSIVAQVCYALRPLHKSSYIHRDVKPANILFASDKRIKLSDFGCAVFSKEERAEAPAGTFAYMAPEIANFKPRCPESDIYSLGILFYQLLHGKLPYDPPLDLGDFQEMIEQGEPKVTWPVSPPGNISPFLKDVVLKATQFNPDDRYHSVDEMLSMLNLYLSQNTESQNTETFLSEYLEAPIDIGQADKFNLANLRELIKTEKKRIFQELDDQIIKKEREKILLENFDKAFEKEEEDIFQGLKDEMKIIFYNSCLKSLSLKNGYLGVEHLIHTLTLKGDGLLYQSILRAKKSPEEIRRKIEEEIDDFQNTTDVKNLLSPRLKQVISSTKQKFPDGVGEKEFLIETLKEKNFVTLLFEEEKIDLAQLQREVEANAV